MRFALCRKKLPSQVKPFPARGVKCGGNEAKTSYIASFMKCHNARWCGAISFLLAGLCLAVGAAPLVTIQATKPLASEPGNNPAVFTFSRMGDTNSALTVPFDIGGTARNGVDYVAITNSVSLAVGQSSAEVVITPITEPSATGYKTVVLTLPGRHFSGPFDRAVAYIAYNYTNIPPVISVVTPTNGQSYLSLPNIEIAANAFDSNGWVTTVQFLANGTSLGVVSNRPSVLPLLREPHGSVLPLWLGNHVNRYQYIWTNAPPGDYSLTAVATDNAGLQTASAAVNIVVTTNLPAPMVRIVNPSSGAEFPDMAPINIYAAAAEDGGVVDTVEFLANGKSLGVVTNYLATEPSSEFRLRTQWLPYFFRWTNAPIGSNVLTAVATDNNGTQAVSAPVGINVSTNVYHFRDGR